MTTAGPVETNAAIWPNLETDAKSGFQEVWYLKLNDPATSRALWIRFTLLTSANGFKRVAETWAIHFHRGEGREIQKLAVKQTHDISVFKEKDGVLRIGECELSDTHTRGAIQSKGKLLRWDLRIDRVLPDGATGRFNAVPESLARAKIVKNRVLTPGENLTFTGTSEIDGEVREWKAAPGMQSHLAGPKNGHSWVWGHGNACVNEQGHPVPFVFEGLCARARMAGGMPTPKLSAFYFLYQGTEYRFNSFWDAVRSRSENTLTGWTFQADRGDISFRGAAKAEHRDFAGITYEDTDGSLLFCANSKLSDLQILVYRRGKLEATLKADGTAAFEVVSRHKNPYVPLLL